MFHKPPFMVRLKLYIKKLRYKILIPVPLMKDLTRKIKIYMTANFKMSL